jgi:hypothetical protein
MVGVLVRQRGISFAGCERHRTVELGLKLAPRAPLQSRLESRLTLMRKHSIPACEDPNDQSDLETDVL